MSAQLQLTTTSVYVLVTYLPIYFNTVLLGLPERPMRTLRSANENTDERPTIQQNIGRENSLMSESIEFCQSEQTGQPLTFNGYHSVYK